MGEDCRRIIPALLCTDLSLKWLWKPFGSPFEEFAQHTSMINFVLSPWLAGRGSLLGHRQLLEELPRVVYRPLGFLTDLARECRAAAPQGNPESFIATSHEIKFNSAFFIGPGGLHGVLEPLGYIYQFVTECVSLTSSERDDAFSQMERLSEDSLWLLQHFRFKISRTLYDPMGGFREFALAYKKTEFYMDVSLYSFERPELYYTQHHLCTDRNG